MGGGRAGVMASSSASPDDGQQWSIRASGGATAARLGSLAQQSPSGQVRLLISDMVRAMWSLSLC